MANGRVRHLLICGSSNWTGTLNPRSFERDHLYGTVRLLSAPHVARLFLTPLVIYLVVIPIF